MSGVDGGGFVVLPGEGRRVTMGGFDIRFLASSNDTAGLFALIETSEPQPAGGPPLHLHRDAAESFYVIAGAYRMHIAGRDFECPPGAFVYVPATVPHTFQVVEPGSRKLNLFTPAAMEGYFVELAEGIAAGVDEAGLERIAERFNMEILGPPPGDYLTRRPWRRSKARPPTA